MMDTDLCFRILEKYDPQCAEFYRERGYLVGADVKRYAEHLARQHSKKKDNLPDEFYFVSHINDVTRGEMYHAKRNHEWSDEFTVVLGPSRWAFNGQELERHVNSLDFEIKKIFTANK
jgi:hypothetical protein